MELGDWLLYIGAPILGSVFILYAIFYCMDLIGTNCQVSKWKKRVSVVGYILVTLIVALLQSNICNFMMLLFVPILGHFFYHNGRNYLIYYISFVVGIFLTDLCVGFILQLVIVNGVVYFTEPQYYQIMVLLSIRFAEFFILRVLAAIIRRKNREKITLGQLVSSVLLFCFSLFNSFTMLSLVQIYPSTEHMLLVIGNVLALIFIDVFVTNIFNTMGRNNQLENELNLYHQQEQLQARYYENLEEKYNNTRKLVHDIRNHVQAMAYLYQEQQSERGIEYTQDIHEMLNQLGETYYTSNKMLNILLNDKVQQMKRVHITEDIKIAEVSFSFMRDVDITTLFGNLLDNAIKAVNHSKERQIRIRIAKVQEFISITLENSCDTKPYRIEKHFFSTKKYHQGIGLKNVERVVEAYRGDVQYEWNNKCFITRIMFAI